MKKQSLCMVIFLLMAFFRGYSQEIGLEKITKWHQFTKVEFDFNGRQAWYIEPDNPLPNKPWVWRAHFPNWHTQVDSILLERGFHIAYLNTNSLYGHSSAMVLWNQFHRYLVDKKDFAYRVALEAVSRGGLYSYGWAKRNPSKVSAIYAEAPVCDFKSWPMGAGSGKGSVEDWNKLLQIYGLTGEQALAYADQPMDNLESLAAFNIPILHAIGLNDRIVPVEENTLPLVNRYIRMGGSATIIPMTKGKQTLDGHHFEIVSPAQIADFIFSYSFPVKPRLRSEDFIQSYGNLSNSFSLIKNKKKITIAYLGGSITNMKGWRDKVSDYLLEQYPETEFTFLNAGVPSLGSLPHAFRLQHDVFNKGVIDLMFIESAVNDHVNLTPEDQQRKALEGVILQAYQHNPSMDIVMMAFVDEEKIGVYKQGEVPLEVRVHEELAKHYQLPFVNLAEEISARIDAGEFTWKDDFIDLHPSLFGQELYAASIKSLLSLEQDKLPVSKLKPVVPIQKLQVGAYAWGNYASVSQSTKKMDFRIDTDWVPKDGVTTREGFVHVPVLEGNIPGAEFEFSFHGSAVGIAIVSGPDAGRIHYSIDGGKEQKIDLFTQWSPFLHLPWFILLGDQLTSGKHQLKLRVANDHHENSKGTACRIVHFLVNAK